jgi:hypothetical protein
MSYYKFKATNNKLYYIGNIILRREHANGNLSEAFNREGIDSFAWMVFTNPE